MSTEPGTVIETLAYGIAVKHSDTHQHPNDPRPPAPFTVEMGDNDNGWAFDDAVEAVHFAAVLEGVVKHHRERARAETMRVGDTVRLTEAYRAEAFVSDRYEHYIARAIGETHGVIVALDAKFDRWTDGGSIAVKWSDRLGTGKHSADQLEVVR